MTPELMATDSSLESVLDACGAPLRREDQDAVYAVGRHLYDAADYVRASDVFRLLALIAPARARSWTSLAACHDALGDADRARALYGLALTVSDHDNHRSFAAAHKARLDLEQGDDDAASAALEEVEEGADPQVAAIVEGVRRALSRPRRTR